MSRRVFRGESVLNKDYILEVVFILLINVKMPTIVGIVTFISRINLMSRGRISFIISWPG